MKFKLTQNQYYGLESFLPSKMETGSVFFSVDTARVYLYDEDMRPVLVSGGGGGGGAGTLAETTALGNVTPDSMQSPRLLSDQLTQANWFEINKNFLSMGDLGDGAGGPYNGNWTKYFTVLDPNSAENALNFYATLGDSSYSELFIEPGQAYITDKWVPTNSFVTFGSTLGRFRINENVNLLNSWFEIEQAAVNNHHYFIPASTEAATNNYLTIGISDGTSTAYTNQNGVTDISGLNLGGGGGGSTIITQNKGVEVDAAATTLNFTGAAVAVDSGGGVTSINVTAGGDTTRFSIEDYGAVADNGTTDSSQAWIDAIDACVAAGGGTVVVPNRGDDRFHITNADSFLIKDMSNITVEGGGKIFIDGSNAGGGAQNVAQGRGTLIKIADGTDNFTIRDLDILVDEAALANNFINAVICQEELGGWSNVTIENLKIHTEARPTTQGGTHAISFYRDTANALDVATGSNLTIRGCDIFGSGNSMYGIQINRTVDNILIDNNLIELEAWNTANESYNAIAVYGDSKNFSVTNNKIISSGHSPIAASMSENGVIAFNRVYNVGIVNEAGIEVEYKQGHGTNLTDPDFQTKSIKVHNNYVENCYWGIAVLTREPVGGNATDVPPYDVQITNNTVMNSTDIGIIAASSISGTPNYTNGRIKNVIVDGNYVESEVAGADEGIHFFDTDGGKILNNIVKGAIRPMKIGRSADIVPIGYFDVRGNEFYAKSDVQTQMVHVESAGDGFRINLSNNMFDGGGFGTKGFQASNLTGTGMHFMVRNNQFFNCSDGIEVINDAADNEGSSIIGNYAQDCTARGFRFSSDNGLAMGNVSLNCPTADNFGGAGMVSPNNQDL